MTRDPGDAKCLPLESTHITRSSDEVPNPDGSLENTVRTKVIHYRRLYVDLRDLIVFMYLFFFLDHQEDRTLGGELRRNLISFDFFTLLPYLTLNPLVRS
jgi:hypothetical protein